MTLALYGTLLEHNQVNAFGSAIFFVTNDLTGTVHIENCISRDNAGGSWYALPGISMRTGTACQVIGSTLQ
jgi:hypothetical protein